MRELKTAIAGIDAAATLRPGHAKRGLRQLNASEPGRQRGTVVDYSQRH